MVDDDFDDALGQTISGEVGNTGDEGNEENAGNSGTTDDTSDESERKNVKNYPLYISESLREDLDEQYDQYDAKSKLNGDGGIEKHAEFLEPVMRAALDEVDLDEIVLNE